MTSPITVKKFGGTSVGSLERIEHVAERVARDLARGEKPILVASAMSGETNRLVDLARSISPSYRGPAYDLLVSSGEQVSISLLAMALEKRGLKARPLLAFQLGIRTDSLYSKAKILEINGQKLLDLVDKGVVPVIAGFQGIDNETNVTTLGRGGSDTTAVAVAASIGSPTCEIYTDVPAVCTADPRLVPRASEISQISFEEMMEMASLGSKVLHIRAVELAVKYGVRIHLRSTFENREGTWIVPEGEILENPVVSSVTHDAATVIFRLSAVPPGPEFLAGLFQELADAGVVVDIISQSQKEEVQRLTFSINREDFHAAQKVLDQVVPKGTTVSHMDNLAKVSVVGVGMRTHFGVAARFFRVFSKLDVPVHLVTTSEIKISAVTDMEHLESVAQALHREFGLDAAEKSL